MQIQRLFKAGLLCTALALAGLAQAATVYCPNGPTGALSAPTSGRYVQVTNAANPGTCYYQTGNLQNADFPTVAAAAGVPAASFLLLDENGSVGSQIGALSFTGSTLGTWALSSSIWSSYSSLHLGFHFGNGGGNPDSFVVQLETNQLSGNWAFNAVAPESLNGLSNYYLFGVASSGNPPPNRVPEPGSLALAALGLLAAGATRRRAVK